MSETRSLVHAPQGPADSEPGTFALKFRKDFYQAVPHLFDGEIQVQDHPCTLSHTIDGPWNFFRTKPGRTDGKFDALKATLRTQKQLEPIYCDEEGVVLDGFGRWFACLEEGTTPTYQPIPGLGDDAAKVTWIRSRKLARQNLTEKQRMAIVQAEIRAHPERSSAWTAELLGVSPQTVANYRSRMEKAGELSAHTVLVCSDGRKVSHSPKAPLTRDELDAAQTKAAQRQQGKKDEVIQEFLKANEGLLLTPDNPDKTLQNILKVVSETDLTNPVLADDLKAVQAGIHRQQEAGWQPHKVERRERQTEEAIFAALCQEFSIDAINGISNYLGELVRAVATGQLDSAGETDEILVNATRALIGNAQELLSFLTGEGQPGMTASVTATATWSVQTVDVAKTKAGLSIKLKPDHAPGKVDVVEQVIPGPVVFGGKTINFQAAKGLLLLPAKVDSAKDATIAPHEDDLLATGTAGPIDPDELLNASDN